MRVFPWISLLIQDINVLTQEAIVHNWRLYRNNNVHFQSLSKIPSNKKNLWKMFKKVLILSQESFESKILFLDSRKYCFESRTFVMIVSSTKMSLLIGRLNTLTQKKKQLFVIQDFPDPKLFIFNYREKFLESRKFFLESKENSFENVQKITYLESRKFPIENTIS